jgi:hypothetical protein
MADAAWSRMQSKLRMVLVAALLLPGCYAGVSTQGAAYAAGPELVVVSPGVEVVADYDRPIFYADGLYWWSSGGVWYQSNWYGGGWVRARHVSPRVYVIAHPEHYAHYRPHGWSPGHGGGRRIEARGGAGVHQRHASYRGRDHHR